MYTSVLLFFAIVLFSYFIYKGNKNTKNVTINRIILNSDKTASTYSNQSQIHILQLSDLHLENLSITPQELYNHVKNEKIDLIALTGDFLDRKRSIPKLIPYLEVLNKLQANIGIFAVFGNHDYVLKGKNFDKLKQTLNDYGVQTLQNEHLSLVVKGKKINIIGVDDFSTKRSNLAATYQNLEKGYNLVLTHDPNVVLKMGGFHFDYLLSGHFHGGQIHWPKPYHLVKMGRLARLNIIKGLHYHDGKPYYISEGLGQTGVNIRVGSLPEITIHQITFDDSMMNEEKQVI